MNYEFVTTIATIVLVGASIAAVILQALKAHSDLTDARFDRIDKRFEQVDQRFKLIDQRFEQVDQRFEKIDQRMEKFEERFYEIQKEFTRIQKEFNIVHSAIARLAGLLEGAGASIPAGTVPKMDRQA